MRDRHSSSLKLKCSCWRVCNGQLWTSPRCSCHSTGHKTTLASNACKSVECSAACGALFRLLAAGRMSKYCVCPTTDTHDTQTRFDQTTATVVGHATSARVRRVRVGTRNKYANACVCVCVYIASENANNSEWCVCVSVYITIRPATPAVVRCVRSFAQASENFCDVCARSVWS